MYIAIEQDAARNATTTASRNRVARCIWNIPPPAILHSGLQRVSPFKTLITATCMLNLIDRPRSMALDCPPIKQWSARCRRSIRRGTQQPLNCRMRAARMQHDMCGLCVDARAVHACACVHVAHILSHSEFLLEFQSFFLFVVTGGLITNRLLTTLTPGGGFRSLNVSINANTPTIIRAMITGTSALPGPEGPSASKTSAGSCSASSSSHGISQSLYTLQSWRDFLFTPVGDVKVWAAGRGRSSVGQSAHDASHSDSFRCIRIPLAA